MEAMSTKEVQIVISQTPFLETLYYKLTIVRYFYAIEAIQALTIVKLTRKELE
jgi:hypothetical protein